MISVYNLFEGEKIKKFKKHMKDHWKKYAVGAAVGAGVGGAGATMLAKKKLSKEALGGLIAADVALHTGEVAALGVGGYHLLKKKLKKKKKE